MSDVIIENQFRGPTDCGNGGYVGGLVAAKLGDGCARVKLRRPAPLDKPLKFVTTSEGKTQLLDGELLIAEAEPSALEVSLPELPSWQACEKANEIGGAGEGSPFAYCFACGRLHPRGMQVLTGPVENSQLVAAAWVPNPIFGDADGRLPDHYVWSALDCPGGFALAHAVSDQPFLTGSISVKIHQPIMTGTPYRIVGWSEGMDGRWQVAATALVDDSDKPLAVCRSHWIAAK